MQNKHRSTIIIFALLICLSWQIDPIRSYISHNNWALNETVQQVTPISQAQILVKTNTAVYLSNTTSPTTSNRRIVSSNNGSIPISVSYTSKSLIFVQNNKIKGTSVQSIRKQIKTINSTIKSSIIQHLDSLFFQILVGESKYIGSFNLQTNKSEISSVVVEKSDMNQGSQLVYNQPAQLMFHYQSPYFTVFDPQLNIKQKIIFAQSKNREIQSSINAQLLTFIGESGAILMIRDNKTHQYSSTLKFFNKTANISTNIGTDCNQITKQCRFFAYQRNAQAYTGILDATASSQRSVSQLNASLTYQTMLQGCGFIIGFADAALQNIVVYSIKEKIFVKQLTVAVVQPINVNRTKMVGFSSDGEVLVVTEFNQVQNVTMLRMVNLQTNLTVLLCEDVKSLLTLTTKFKLLHDRQHKLLYIIQSQNIYLYSTQTCQSTSSVPLPNPPQTYHHDLLKSLLIVIDSKGTLTEYNDATLQVVKSINLTTTKHVFVSGDEVVLIGLQDNGASGYNIVKYRIGTWDRELEQNTNFCNIQAVVLKGGYNHFRTICRNVFITVYNTTNLFTIHQTERSITNPNQAQCTFHPTLSLWQNKLYQTDNIYISFEYFQRTAGLSTVSDIIFKDAKTIIFLQLNSTSRQYLLTIADITNILLPIWHRVSVGQFSLFDYGMAPISLSSDGKLIILSKTSLFPYRRMLQIYDMNLNKIYSVSPYTDQINAPAYEIGYCLDVKNQYVYISGQNVTFKFDVDTDRISVLDQIVNVEGELGLSNSGNEFIVGGKSINQLLIAEHRNRQQNVLIASYQLSNQQAKIRQFQFSPTDSIIILVQDNILYKLVNKTFVEVQTGVDRCDFIGQLQLICHFMDKSVKFVYLTLQEGQLMDLNVDQLIVSAGRNQVITVSQHTITLHQILEGKLQSLYSVTSPQDTISAAVINQDGSVLTYNNPTAKQMGTIYQWTEQLTCPINSQLASNKCQCSSGYFQTQSICQQCSLFCSTCDTSSTDCSQISTAGWLIIALLILVVLGVITVIVVCVKRRGKGSKHSQGKLLTTQKSESDV